MHPVLEHILARRGKAVPVDDGRKIALVLYGGGMSGVAGAGAMIAFEDLGLAHAFDAIYAYSAGFPNASYLLGDKTRLGTSIYYEDLSRGQFIKLWRFWRIMDVNYFIRVITTTKLLPVDQVLCAATELYVRLWRVGARRTEYVEAHRFPGAQYLQLMTAATSLRHAGIGSIQLGDDRYEDYPFGVDAPEHLLYVLGTEATDILVIYNRPDQRPRSVVLDERCYEIMPEIWVRNTCPDPNKLKHVVEAMANQVYHLFGDQRILNL